MAAKRFYQASIKLGRSCLPRLQCFTSPLGVRSCRSVSVREPGGSAVRCVRASSCLFCGRRVDTCSTLFTVDFDACVHEACPKSAALDGENRADPLEWEFGLDVDSNSDEDMTFDLTPYLPTAGPLQHQRHRSDAEPVLFRGQISSVRCPSYDRRGHPNGWHGLRSLHGECSSQRRRSLAHADRQMITHRNLDLKSYTVTSV